MKISIITVTFNSSKTIRDTIKSVQEQTYDNIEHIIVDGNSNDGTQDIIQEYKNIKFISEPDEGIYFAMNKGIDIATGEIVGFLNSDDVFMDHGCVEEIARSFKEREGIDVVYGNIRIVSPKDIYKTIRFIEPGKFKKGNLLKGWLPPHPTLYVRAKILRDLRGFNTSFEIQADFEMMIRIFEKHDFKSYYINRTLVRMRFGGTSQKISNLIRGNIEASNACKINGYPGGLYFIIVKMMSRLPQFINRPSTKINLDHESR